MPTSDAFQCAVEDMDVFDEIMPLAMAHADEITYDVTRGEPLDVNEEAYRALANMGILKIFTVRRSRRLVGYLVYVVSHSLDRRYLKQAFEGGFFILPKFRGTSAALRLMRFAEKELSDQGCDMVLYHSPAANPRFGALLSRLGYSKVDEVFARRLPCQVH